MPDPTTERMAALRLAMHGKSLFAVELCVSSTAMVVASDAVEARQIAEHMRKADLDWSLARAGEVEMMRHCDELEDVHQCDVAPASLELTVADVCAVLAERTAWRGAVKPEGHVQDTLEGAPVDEET